MPAELRGTYAGLAHPVVVEYLQALDITTVEQLAVNLGDQPLDVALREDWRLEWRLELASAAGLEFAHGRLTLPPLSVALLLSGGA